MRRFLAGLIGALAVGCVGQAAYGQGTQSTGGPRTSQPQPTASVGQAPGSAGQGGGGTSWSCTATNLHLTFVTGDDDLRGGSDNLNIIIYFANGQRQTALNVNNSHNWPNKSVNQVDILLNPPVPPNEIGSLRLLHTPDGFNINAAELLTPAAPLAIAKAFQSPDNWNMAALDVEAIVSGARAVIAKSGFNRFTGSNPSLTVYAHIPPNICGAGGNNSGGGAGGNAGPGGGAHSGSGGGSGSSSGGGGVLSGGSRGTGGPTQRSSSGTGGSVLNSGTAGAGSLSGPNNDVIKMVEAGLPNSAIIASIRSRPGGFDLSNQARADLFAAGEKNLARQMNEIWDAMIAKTTNGRGGDSADELSAQPYPPKQQTAAPSPANKTTPTVGGQPSGTPGINGSPKADQLSPQPYPPKGNVSAPGGIAQRGTQFVVPQNLKIVTGAEVKNPAVMTSPMRPLVTQPGDAGTLGPGQTQSTSGSGAPGASSTTATRLMLATPSASNAAGAPPTGSTNPSAGVGASGNSNRYAGLQQNVKTCLDRTGIASVVEKAGSSANAVQAVFTPDINTGYIITGCGFGSTPGKIYLTGGFGANGGKVALYPYRPFGAPHSPGWGSQWTDQQIEASVDPNISGELDQNNISLVIETSTGAHAQANGFSFYARRGSPVMVSGLPTSSFCETRESYCNTPGFVDGGAIDSWCMNWGLSNCSVTVLRQSPFVDGKVIDRYTLNFKPGFVLYSAGLLVGIEQQYTNAIKLAEGFAPKITGNQIFVQEPVVDPNGSYSLYGLKILVVGPIGVNNPWAGQ